YQVTRCGSCTSLWVRLSALFVHDTAPTEIYTLSLHDALPISARCDEPGQMCAQQIRAGRQRAELEASDAIADGKRRRRAERRDRDRKSTRLNSSHRTISYAVFCLKKKKKKMNTVQQHDTTA